MKGELTSHQEYWLDALSEALDVIGKYDIISDEEKKEVAKRLDSAQESMCYAFYSPPATDFVNSEVRELKERIKNLERQVEKEREDFRKNVAMRRGCDPNEVTLIGNGHAEYR